MRHQSLYTQGTFTVHHSTNQKRGECLQEFLNFLLHNFGLRVSMIDISVTIRPKFSAEDWADIVIEDES